MGANNKYYFTIPTGTKTIDLPIEIKWDNYGQSESIELWEKTAIEEVIGLAKDFDILRFAHDEYGTNQQTSVNYKFHFYNENTATWDVNYQAEGFTTEENYYISNGFEKSFFKLDFYDSTENQNQTIYFTVILPLQTGEEYSVSISPYLPPVSVERPEFILDYTKNREGFFMYWMRDKKFLNLDTFYMTAKFFDAKLGIFVRMMNVNPSTLPDPTLFDTARYFYNKVVLDYNTYTYKIYNYGGTRIGTGTPMNWYEYIDPS